MAWQRLGDHGPHRGDRLTFWREKAAVERHLDSFCTLLRWICCPLFVYSAFAAYANKHGVWVWVFGLLATLYNPIFRVHLDRSNWIGLNWITVGIIAVAGFVFCVTKEIRPTQTIKAGEAHWLNFRDDDDGK